MALEPSAVRIAVHVTIANGGPSAGTFVATGLVGDSGTTGTIERYPSLQRGLRVPLVVHGAESFAGTRGTIALAYDGVFRRVAPGVFSGEGAWRVTGGDHAYETLDGEGSWTATVVFGRHGTTVDTIYEGRGELHPQPAA